VGEVNGYVGKLSVCLYGFKREAHLTATFYIDMHYLYLLRNKPSPVCSTRFFQYPLAPCIRYAYVMHAARGKKAADFVRASDDWPHRILA
jgi:hypothetical protein